ncbi:Ca2+-binding RTX toxin-like protein [Azospirillum fermentarium]|uniref:calcium-binding protein n=1 Tax=Azospirillum fermentarium TaxID=1233114 RepID=UPI002227C62C|nr:calcium-binding protein [Azospirillum fermentarium]MCW2248792.1 Ca2+-binding RTX toxin-like protein [Azospirillum fermentarium]
MTVLMGDATSEVLDLRGKTPDNGGNSNAAYGQGGNDTIHGSSFMDLLTGDAGNDSLLGYDGNDTIAGGTGNDTMYGGNGNDYVLGGAGSDHLYGGAGNDTMYGGFDNDVYYHGANEGVDLINDNKNEAGNDGYGGGSADMIYFSNVTQANISYYRSGNSLILSSTADLSDGYLDDGVIIDNFYLGGNYVVESLKTSDGLIFNLSTLL